MLELALRYGEGPILLKEIADRQGISEKYLWQLINPLKITGLVNSQRGAHGGYVLGKAPEAISLKEILQILEGSLCLVDCVDDPALCERSSSCISRDIWGEASKEMQRSLEDTTLAVMVERQREKLKNEKKQ
jgi:Rrf2 family protein